jgi:type III pantothenate kinase
VILLIDAGNSRIKWAIHDAGQWLAQGNVLHGDSAGLSADWQAWPLERAYATSVAGDAVRQGLEACCAVPIRWIQAEAEAQTLGVRNHYHDPAQMGADRWLAVLAARRLYPEDVIVVCAGTALTVESLTRDGDYLGGLILPGYSVMLDSLAQNTARLKQAAGEKVDFPQCTADALASGVGEALVGAVERARSRLAQYAARPVPLVMITGGDAARIAPWLASPVRIVDNLVLMGLLEVANQS